MTTSAAEAQDERFQCLSLHEFLLKHGAQRVRRDDVERLRAAWPPQLVAESEEVDGKVIRLDHKRAVLEVTEGDRVLHSVPVADPSRGLVAAVRDARARLYDFAQERRRRGGWVIGKDVQRERVAWLWASRIPFGKVTLLDGDPGQLKSTLGLDFAARLSTGRAMPGETDAHEPTGAVIVSYEDGPGDTIRPRLEAAGADLGRIAIFNLDRPPILPGDLDRIRQAIRDVNARFVLIDPLMAALTGRVDSHRDQDIRRALQPLTALAEETGAAILVVRHLNKNDGKGMRAIYRGGGSIGIAGAARSVLVVGYDPDFPEDLSRHVLAPVKMNLCAMPPTLRYRATTVKLDDQDETVKVEWAGESAITADALLAQPSTNEGRSTVEEVTETLRQMLANGPTPAREAERALKREYSEWAIKAAKKRLGVVSAHEGGGKKGRWMWLLPTRAALVEGGMELTR